MKGEVSDVGRVGKEDLSSVETKRQRETEYFSTEQNVVIYLVAAKQIRRFPLL